MLRQLLKEGNYSREEIFSGNTVCMGIKSDADNQTMGVKYVPPHFLKQMVKE